MSAPWRSWRNRRTRRSFRVFAASSLLGGGLAAVTAANVTSDRVPPAAQVAAWLAVGTGLVAGRLLYTEVTRTRREAAVRQAEIARTFAGLLGSAYSSHAEFTGVMARRIADRDAQLDSMRGAVGRAERRVEDAQARADHEAERANAATQRLAELVDEVNTDGAEGQALSAVGIPEAADLPTLVELLAWDQAVQEALTDEGVPDSRQA